MHNHPSTISRKRINESGSAFLLALIAIMILAVLTAVIITSIPIIREGKKDYIQKAKVQYLAESANAIARNALLDSKKARQWKNIAQQNLEGGVISAQIAALDNHLWQIDTIAEDITRTIKFEISNIVRPYFEYAVITSALHVKNGPDEITIYGNIYSKIYQLDKSITYYPAIAENEPLYEIAEPVTISPETQEANASEMPEIEIPQLNKAQFSSLLPFPSETIHLINDETAIDGTKMDLSDGIYISLKNITLKNIKINASFISMSGSITLAENCSISAFNNYPALASLRGNITITGDSNPVYIEGLLYGSSIAVRSPLTVRGALYAQDSIVLERKPGISNFIVNIHFNESILQTKGLIYKWDRLKNISWKTSE